MNREAGLSGEERQVDLVACRACMRPACRLQDGNEQIIGQDKDEVVKNFGYKEQPDSRSGEFCGWTEDLVRKLEVTVHCAKCSPLKSDGGPCDCRLGWNLRKPSDP